MELQNIITEDKINNYLKRTDEAITIIKKGLPSKRSLLYNIAEDYLTMILCYYEDAKIFKEKGDYVNSFASLNYAYGWIDAGARLGIFNVGDDDIRFTLAN